MTGASIAACCPVSSFEKRSTSASKRCRIWSTVDFSWSGIGMLRTKDQTITFSQCPFHFWVLCFALPAKYSLLFRLFQFTQDVCGGHPRDGLQTFANHWLDQ